MFVRCGTFECAALCDNSAIADLRGRPFEDARARVRVFDFRGEGLDEKGDGQFRSEC